MAKRGTSDARRGRAGRRALALGSGTVLASSSAAALLALTGGTAGAAGFVVDTPGDAGDGTCSVGSCTLRDAIDDANASTPTPDVITFDPSITGTITLTNANGEIDITDDLTITGPGRDVLAVSGNDDHRIFSTGAPIDLTISGLTLTAGSSTGEGGAIQVTDQDANLTLTDMAFSENFSGNDGGGFQFFGTTLVVTNTTFTHNEAQDDGGGFYSDAATTTVTGSTFSGDNHAGEDAGGFFIYGGDSHTTITDTVVSGNSANGSGGGASFYSDSQYAVFATIENTTFSGNTAGFGGGGFYADDFNGVVRNSTISGNQTTDEGFGNGGGISTNGDDLQMQIVNSTISGNTSRQGGGLYMYSYREAGVQLLQSTVAGNTALYNGAGIYVDDDDGANSLLITGSIVALNTGPTGTGAAAQDISTTSTTGRSLAGKPADPPDASNPERSGGNERVRAADVSALAVGVQLTSSLVQGSIDPNITVVDGGGNLFGVDPQLGALANNGGPTQTRALNAGSPAINTGPAVVPTFPGNEFDQRGPGYNRVMGGRVDIGAFEVQAIEVVVRFTG